MICTYGDNERLSDSSAPFFESRMSDSTWAANTCGICNYAPQAHKPKIASQPHLAGKTSHKFKAHQGDTMDRYYCGCWGWD